MPVSLAKPIVEILDPVLDSFQSMSGDFSQWTLADADWYHRQLGWDFRICGDTKRIVAIDAPFIRKIV